MFAGPSNAALRRGAPRALQNQSSCVVLRCFASPPMPSPSYFDPKTHAKTAEDKRLNYISNDESKYALGKHRCNALELVSKVPIVEVEKEMAVCDGGGGALGHPVEYISLARPGSVETCKYCGIRYTQKKH